MKKRLTHLAGVAGLGLTLGAGWLGAPWLFAQAQVTLTPPPFPVTVPIQIPTEAYGVLGQHTFSDGLRCAYLVTPGGTQLTCDWTSSPPAQAWTTMSPEDEAKAKQQREKGTQ